MERQDLDMQLKNNKKYTVLVSGASGIVGYGILRSLKETDAFLIGTTIYETSPADCFSDLVMHPPLTGDETYIPWLIDVIIKYNVDMIIPAIEADMSEWNKHRAELEATGAYVMLNNSGLIELCLDKWRFYQCLCEHDFEYRIDTALDISGADFGFPLILKPRCGFGSRGLIKVNSLQELKSCEDEIGDNLIVQKYVGSEQEEYTVSAFFDLNSEMKAIISMKRKLSKLGYTENAETVVIPDIVKIIEIMTGFLKPIGPTNFQFRWDKDKWRLLEINPRISSSTSIRKGFGYNDAQMCIDYFLEHKSISQPVIKQGSSVRYTEDYFFYDSADI